MGHRQKEGREKREEEREGRAGKWVKRREREGDWQRGLIMKHIYRRNPQFVVLVALIFHHLILII